MPPSLPTGTVSQTSAGTRTFPPESASEPDRERASATSTVQRRQPRVESLSPTPSQSPPRSAVVPRREHDVAVSREHERVAELQHENEVLRDYIEAQAAERQSVIERYERLLDQQERQQPTSASTDPTFAAPQTTAANLLDSLRSVATRLRSRLGVS